jgi:hypothetical protein
MINDFYGNMAVYKQQVAELEAQAQRDRMAKEFRAARRRQRAERRTADRLEAAFNDTPHGALATVKGWFGIAGHGRPAAPEQEPAQVAEAGPVHEPADRHPAGIRS